MASHNGPNHPVPQHTTAYQVDYVAVNCGRIVAASKRRIRFKFGYANQEALDSGKTGQEARGSEHEIAIIWSLSSGKQAIAFDQHEVYFDVGEASQTKISHTFTDQRGHNISVIAHAANMSAKSIPDPDWQQYDIIVDGVSFFRMPKIFEIGVVPTADPNSTWEYDDAPHSRHSSPTTILPHEEHEEPSTVQTEPPAVADLLSFDALDDAPAVPQPKHDTNAPPTQTNNYAPHPQCPPQMPTNASHQNQVVPTTTQFEEHQCYATAPTYQYAAPNNHQHLNSQIQGYPNNNNNNASPTASPVAVQNPATLYVAPTPMATTSYAQDPHPVTPPQEVSTELVPTETAPMAGYGIDGIKSLVNLDNLLDTSATAPVTQQSVDARMKEANAHKSLCQLQGSNNATNGEKKPVMNQFNPTPVYPQQQQMMYPCASGYIAQQQQQPPQQPLFNQHQQQYAHQGFGN